MKKGILLVALMIVNMFLLVLAIVISFSRYYYYLPVVIMGLIMLYLLISIMFFRYTNLCFENEKDTLRSCNLIRCVKWEKERYVIEFTMKDNKWICNQNKKIEISLDDYLFKKSFIMAKVIREVRYPVISKRLALSKLFKFTLENNQIENLIVRFIDDSTTREWCVVRDYVSKNTFLTAAITKSKYYKCFLGNQSYEKYILRKEKIDENIYLSKH